MQRKYRKPFGCHFRYGIMTPVSPDSDTFKWIALVAALVQTCAAIVQVRQGHTKNADDTARLLAPAPTKWAVGCSLTGVLVLVAADYIFDQSTTTDGQSTFDVIAEFQPFAQLTGFLAHMCLMGVFGYCWAAMVFNVLTATYAGENTGRAVAHMVIAAASAATLLAVARAYFPLLIDKFDERIMVVIFLAIPALVGGFFGWLAGEIQKPV